jgi:hypothetical protein
MKSWSLRLLPIVVFAGACGAPATVATRPVPAPIPATAAPSVQVQIPPVTLTEAPRDWQLLDESIDHVPGISANRAMRELLAGKAPRDTVLVAIIDNGIDTLHADLRANLWTDPTNGTHGWDFIGGADGQDVNFDTFEVTRQYARCHGQAAASGAPPITDAAQCKQIDADFEKQRSSIEPTAAS